jgi:hypothetical protein
MLADDPARANFARNKTLIDLRCAPVILAGIDAVVSGGFAGGLGQRMVQSTF